MNNLANFHKSMFKSLKFGTFIGSFYPKQKMYEHQIYRGVMCHENKEWCKIWRGLHLSIENWYEEFHKFWPEHSKISKIWTLMICFWPHYIMFELKKVQRSYFSSYWRLMQHWKENWLVLSKMTWRIWQIFTGAHSKVKKLGLFLGAFIQSRKCVSFKFTGELCVMRMKNDAKFEEELTCEFKIDMTNLTNFDRSIQKSQKVEL